MSVTEKDIERFLLKVDKTDSCWIWTAGKNKGYGQFNFQNKTYKSHRFSYEVFKGPIVDGLCVCHSCDNPSCVNPEHLWLGTNHQNILDSAQKGRRAQQKKTHCPKGHEYSQGNTVVTNGSRLCKECLRAKQVIRYRNKHGIPLDKPLVLTHCGKGHEFSPENTSHYNGKRICKSCHRDKNRAYQRRKRDKRNML